jgi:hypothetical protein
MTAEQSPEDNGGRLRPGRTGLLQPAEPFLDLSGETSTVC